MGMIRSSALLVAFFAVLVSACGSDIEVSIETSDDTVAPAEPADDEAATPIADREAEVGPAVEAMFAFTADNPDVCTAEFESFNVAYPEPGTDPELTAELDAGIEDRGGALTTCLDAAGEADMSANVELLTLWGRHLADTGA